MYRLWTFTMSCCISSAVCCVMLTASMSGIALGYNYSLAEYIDLKETNVSIFLKRGVFDDEIADDMDWRRSGRMPVAGHIGDNNLRTPASDEESTSIRSGRRLDDSIFDADDQNKYEGSLMKLTAKPIFQDTPKPKVTDDLEMAEIDLKYTKDTLNHLKAIKGLVDARRAMVTGVTTASPVATYDINQRNLPYLPMYVNPMDDPNPANRRVMHIGPGMPAPKLNPARFAVPDQSIGAGSNWLVPKRPDLFNKNAMPDYYVLSPTYPSPITLPHTFMTPTVASEEGPPEGAVMFVTRTIATPRIATQSNMGPDTFEKDSPALNEQLLMEPEPPRKNVQKVSKINKSSEEEYEDEIKGLPVRKRRNIEADTHEHKFASVFISDPSLNKRTKNNDSMQDISSLRSNVTINIKKHEVENDVIDINNNSAVSINNDAQVDVANEGTVKQELKLDKDLKSDSIKSVTTSDQSTESVSQGKLGKTLLDRIVTATAIKMSTLTAVTAKTKLISAKKVNSQARRKSFESNIVSSKYSTHSTATKLSDNKQTTISNADILDSISVNLNEAGLLSDPVSSTFIKLLQSTLT